MRRKSTSKVGAMDIGILWGISLLILAFEVIPGSSIGRLSTRTSTEEMQGFDPGELYEIPPEIPKDDPVDVERIILNDIPDVEPILVISTSEDSTLRVVGTASMNNLLPVDEPDNSIPQPGTFIARSVEPQCTFRPTPDYPEMASQAGVEGRVIIQVFISTEGVPVEALIIDSSGLASMDSAAMASVMKSGWSPAKRADGVPVGVWTSVLYDFVLE